MKNTLILFIILTLHNCSPKVIHNTKTIDSYKQNALQKKFAYLLKIPTDSIYNLSLYKNLESWNSTKDSLDFESIPYPILFINYICYKQYHIELPNSYDEILKSEKVYPYLNTNYLKEGDLIFFKQKNNSHKLVGLYLKNKHFTYASTNGELNYIEIKDTLNNITILSNAKLFNR
ncbi:NlpC/P60 family protein [Plebeiibacterium sediminum]|uniref:C40 family peptidase n=1 Tax=Plebeiibacterium sediminum TaxID=2992112 RepID=A0AAE3M8D4_9BACT|nr:NlpC/P60 family protein [Plebeiobacterium sediminum]MCW3788871.1 C40 family peptidase [Plebeiobacterium sediminum]